MELIYLIFLLISNALVMGIDQSNLYFRLVSAFSFFNRKPARPWENSHAILSTVEVNFSLTIGGLILIFTPDINLPYLTSNIYADLTSFISNLALFNNSPLEVANIYFKQMKIISVLDIKPPFFILNNGSDILTNIGNRTFKFYHPLIGIHIPISYIMPFIGIMSYGVINVFFIRISKIPVKVSHTIFSCIFPTFTKFKLLIRNETSVLNKDSVFNKEPFINIYTDFWIFMNATASTSNSGNNEEDKDKKNKKKPSLKRKKAVINEHKILHKKAFQAMTVLEATLQNLIRFLVQNNVGYIRIGGPNIENPASLTNTELETAIRDLENNPPHIIYPNNLNHAQMEEIRSRVEDFDIEIHNLNDEIIETLQELYALEQTYNTVYELGYRDGASLNLRRRVFDLYDTYRPDRY